MTKVSVFVVIVSATSVCSSLYTQLRSKDRKAVVYSSKEISWWWTRYSRALGLNESHCQIFFMCVKFQVTNTTRIAKKHTRLTYHWTRSIHAGWGTSSCAWQGWSQTGMSSKASLVWKTSHCIMLATDAVQLWRNMNWLVTYIQYFGDGKKTSNFLGQRLHLDISCQYVCGDIGDWTTNFIHFRSVKWVRLLAGALCLP